MRLRSIESSGQPVIQLVPRAQGSLSLFLPCSFVTGHRSSAASSATQAPATSVGLRMPSFSLLGRVGRCVLGLIAEIHPQTNAKPNSQGD